MAPRITARTCLLALAGISLLVVPALALAQEEPIESFDGQYAESVEDEPTLGANGRPIEEILITSQARNTHDDQSISETSFNAEDLKAMRIQDISDVARFTPGLEINTAFAASNPTLFIRGIGLKDYNANAAGAVPVFFDGMAINSPAGQLFQLFDVKNVTVLKGPQSGRWGRNATAGAIIVDSNLPDGEWSSDGSLTYGSYNDVEAIGAIGFPIVDEILSGRVAFTYNRRDGYTKNGCAGWDPEANGYSIKTQAETERLYQELQPASDPTLLYLKNGNPWRQREEVNGPLIHQSRPLYENNALAENLSDPVSQGGFGNLTIKGNRYDSDGNLVYYQTNAFTLAPGRDQGCNLQSPGEVWSPQGALTGNKPERVAGTFYPDINHATMDDFDSLKPYTNNVNNWAARTMFLFTPTEDVEILFGFHGGQNLGDSAHLQMIPVVGYKVDPSLGFNCTGATLDDIDAPCRTPTDVNLFRMAPNQAPHQNWTEERMGEPAKIIPGLWQPTGTQPGTGGSNPYLGFYDRDGQELLDLWGVGIIGRWDQGSFSFHSLTGYEANQRLVEDEGDATPRKLLWTDWSDQAWQISQEFRIEVERDDFSWLVGISALHEEVASLNTWPAAAREETWTQKFDQSLTGLGFFASGHYDFVNGRNSRPWLEELRLSASIRLGREHKNFFLDSRVVTIAGVEAEVIQADPQEATWSGLTGNLMLSWTPVVQDEYDLTLHAKYTRGMKNGHFNAGLTTDPKPQGEGQLLESLLEPVAPEYVNSLEIGFDSSWAEKRILLSGAFYRYWYQDLQVFDLVNEKGSLPTQALLSADARVLGFEADLEVLPLDQVVLTLGFNWLDSTFQDFIVSKRLGGGVVGGGKPDLLWLDYSGNSTIAAPEFQLNGSAQYSFYMPGWGSLNPRLDYSYQTKVFLDPQGMDLISMPAYWYVDLRLSYTNENEDIEVAFWMTNVTDAQYLVDVFDLSRDNSEILQVWGEPRMMGVTVSFFY
ncbi:MAG: TonB-dependent receptor [Myxococcota bacterium]|nr:TonB-dependent receptor [Myxococcota bacterium]